MAPCWWWRVPLRFTIASAYRKRAITIAIGYRTRAITIAIAYVRVLLLLLVLTVRVLLLRGNTITAQATTLRDPS